MRRGRSAALVTPHAKRDHARLKPPPACAQPTPASPSRLVPTLRRPSFLDCLAPTSQNDNQWSNNQWSNNNNHWSNNNNNRWSNETTTAGPTTSTTAGPATPTSGMQSPSVSRVFRAGRSLDVHCTPWLRACARVRPTLVVHTSPSPHTRRRRAIETQHCTACSCDGVNARQHQLCCLWDPGAARVAHGRPRADSARVWSWREVAFGRWRGGGPRVAHEAAT